MNITNEVKLTKKQKLVMILMGVTATLTQGARVQGMIKANTAAAEPK
jgi:hypothetical protein